MSKTFPTQNSRKKMNSDAVRKKEGHRSIFHHLKTVLTAVVLGNKKKQRSTGRRVASDSSGASTASTRDSASKMKSFSSFASSNSSSGSIEDSTFSFAEIFNATERFSNSYKIGEGGFSSVYKAKLRNGPTVAVKRAKKEAFDEKLSIEFKNEIQALSKIEHLNLVKLYGFVNSGKEHIIVVEYVPNGTLRDHLDGFRGRRLEFSERLGIAIDVAHAMTYLHTYSEPPIIHRDIKSTNILITEKLRAKVADFGFAKLTSGEIGVSHFSTQIKGTTGYLDPEYLRTLQLTDRSDVYSFGVLLAELITGRTPVDDRRPSKEKVTVRWALQKLEEGGAEQVMDPNMKHCAASTMASRKLIHLARRCVSPTRESRPSMKECAQILWAIRRDFRLVANSPRS